MDVRLVFVVCCVGSDLHDNLISYLEESYWGVCLIVCDVETSTMARPWPDYGCSATKKRFVHTKYFVLY
jgi:hypothetical protein